MSIKLTQFSQDSLNATSEYWIESADSFGIPTLDYERVLGWAEDHIDYAKNTGDSFAYGVFEDESNKAVAIVDIVYSKRPGPDVGWLKMISISLCPSFSPPELDRDSDKLIQVLDIYATSIEGIILLTNDHKARVIKLYGRNESLLKLLVAVNERLTILLATHFNSRIEGRWLVISAR